MVVSDQRRADIAHSMADPSETQRRATTPDGRTTLKYSRACALSSGSSQAARDLELEAFDAEDRRLDQLYGRYRKGVVPVSCRAPSPFRPRPHGSRSRSPHVRSRSRSRSPSRPSVLETMPDPGFGGPGTQWAPGLGRYVAAPIPVPNPADRIYVTLLNGRTVELKEASPNDPMDVFSHKLAKAAGMTSEELDNIVLVQFYQGPEVPGPKILELLMLPKDAVVNSQAPCTSTSTPQIQAGWITRGRRIGTKLWSSISGRPTKSPL